MKQHNYIACDLGAESGRVILGTLQEDRLSLKEIHRFANGATSIQGSLRWNLQSVYEGLKEGLRKAAALDVEIASISVDSWGVDYVLFNERQPMVSLPFQYRDPRTDSVYAETLVGNARETIFAETGIQFMPINTLYQLISDVEENSDVLAAADQFLTIADYFNYLFSGVSRAEVSLASTTQLYNPVKNAWSERLIDQFKIPDSLFPELVPSGTILGPIVDEVQSETGLNDAVVVASCSHDTSAAVAAVPAGSGEDWAYLSSGTWSLIGVELPKPLINEQVLASNYTNESGFGGTTRFLKNIVGLWLLQESRRTWLRDGIELDYEDINIQAKQAEPFRSLVNPNDARFMAPKDMLVAIQEFCWETNQSHPETPGQFARCIFESLAFSYGHVLDTIETLTGRQIAKLHIVGGGCQSALLNQLAASASGRTVLAGPVEATAIGNILIQAYAMGQIKSLDELRQVVGASLEIETYSPEPNSDVERARDRFKEIAR